MIINHDLLPKQKSRKFGLKVVIDLYPIASELYCQLNSIGLIDRIKEVPQLGLIKVNPKLKKSRYDYLLLQLYFHQIIKKNIQGCLKYTYNNYIKQKEFLPDCIENFKNVSIADIIQCLIIAYNIGHFYNTFTASRAIIMLASESGSPLAELKSSIIYQLPRLSKAFDDIISRKDYQRMHLLNSLIILHNCDSTNLSIKLTKEIIYAYLNEENLPGESKLKYVFKLFRQVRNIAYVAYDLQIANTPFIIEISNEKSIIDFFQELLSAYNNGISATEMVRSIQKLLDSTVYNENCNSICLYQISKKMYQCIKQNGEILSLDNYFREWFQNCYS